MQYLLIELIFKTFLYFEMSLNPQLIIIYNLCIYNSTILNGCFSLLNRYEEVFSLQEEFIQYQLIEDKDIPDDIWLEALVCLKETNGQEEQFHRMDTIWGYLSQKG